jgi:hypothetical protein
MALAILGVSAVKAEAADQEMKITNGTHETVYSFAKKDGKEIGFLSSSELVLPLIINLQAPAVPAGGNPPQAANPLRGNPPQGFADFFQRNRVYYTLPQGYHPTCDTWDPVVRYRLESHVELQLLALTAAHDQALLYGYFGVCPCCGGYR